MACTLFSLKLMDTFKCGFHYLVTDKVNGIHNFLLCIHNKHFFKIVLTNRTKNLKIIPYNSRVDANASCIDN